MESMFKAVFVSYFICHEIKNVTVIKSALPRFNGVFYHVACEGDVMKFFPDRFEVYEDYKSKKKKLVFMLGLDTLVPLLEIYSDLSNFKNV